MITAVLFALCCHGSPWQSLMYLKCAMDLMYNQRLSRQGLQFGLKVTELRKKFKSLLMPLENWGYLSQA